MGTKFDGILPIGELEIRTDDQIAAEIKSCIDEVCAFDLHYQCRDYDRSLVQRINLVGQDVDVIGCKNCGHNEYVSYEILKWLKRIGVVSERPQ